MSDPTYALQIAMAAALLGDGVVSGFVGASVYDSVSAINQPYPMIEIGEDQVMPKLLTEGDLIEVFSTVHVYADGHSGRLMAKQIAEAVTRVLEMPLSLTGYSMASSVLHQTQHLTQADTTDQGQIAHSVLIFHFNIYATP